jgi:outer membrane lipoprotein LolB
VLALSACATRPTDSSDWLSGRLSLKVDRPEARPVSTAFELRGDAEQGELRLTSPLGSVMASASWAPGQARLVTADGERRYADLDALAHDTLGEALPLRALPAWLRGQPWPGAGHQTAADGFEQLGWHIGLARYAEGWLDATRSTPPAVTLRARLDRTP